MSLASFAVRKPITILMIVLASSFLGILSLFSLPVELMPNISYKKITIMVGVRGGMPPPEIESLIVRPIEDAVGSVSNLESIISTAEKDRAIIVQRFIPGTDMDFASLEVREAFAKVKNKLPKETEKPVISKYEESDAPVLIFAVTSIGEKHSPEEIRTIVDQKIKESLMRVPGVANIDVSGGREQKIICNINQDFIRSNKIPIRSIVNKIGAETLNVQVGSRDEDDYRKGLVFKAEFTTLDEISNTAIKKHKKTGTQFLLKEMATVKDDFLEAQNISRYTHFKDKDDQGETSNIVSLYIQKESTANTVAVSARIKEALVELEASIAKTYPDLRVLTVSDQAKFINEAIAKVKSALVSGAFYAFVVLLVFLRSLRTTLVIGIAIPVSMLITFILMNVLEIPINVMTLSGLALGAGMLVDGSICVLEIIFRKKNEGVGAFEAAITGADSVAMEIIAGTLTTIIVFAPIFFVTEQIKMMYEGLAYTVICSLITSLFAALLIVPTLSARISIKERKTSQLAKHLNLLYTKVLSFCLRYRAVLIVFTMIAFFFSLVLGSNLKQELAGGAEQNRFTVFVELPDGAKLEVSDKVIQNIEVYLKNKELFPEVKSVTSRVEGWSSKVYVSLVPKAERDRSISEVIDQLRNEVPKLPEMKKIPGSFVYFSEDGGGDSEEVKIDVYGHNYEILSKLANEVAAKMEEVEGVVDAKLQTSEGRPEFRIEPKKYKMAEFGLSTEEVAQIIHTQIRGLRATAFHPKDGTGREIETLVRLDPQYIQSLENVRNLTVMSPKGHLLFLKDIARFLDGLSPSEIMRTNKSRMLGVSATTTKLPMEQAIAEVKKRLKEVKFPKDYYYVFSGEYYRLLENRRQLTWALLATILLIYMLLASLFESYFQPLIIMTTVPLALIGAILALWYSGKSVTMGVFIGAIMLAGIVVNSAIILVSTINELREQNGHSRLHAILRGGLSRTQPILMTSLTTMLGLFPMATDQSQSANLWAPLAITVMGGMTSATFLTLLIVPGLYILFDDIALYLESPFTERKLLIFFLMFLNCSIIVLGFMR